MKLGHTAFELWGGVECTVNRIGDIFFDQMALSGHHNRISDLDLFASLGIQALRYPVLWEQTAPNQPGDFNWAWADARLQRLRHVNIRPIVGLVHHGSGPRYTHLLDARFPELLAEYAGAVAERYPWIQDYTPINEPLTTARFSGMYGYWYPHGRDSLTFARILLSECRATSLAMRAIRERTPYARLIQTDDLGKVYSTPAMAYQAEHENARRWLSFDLLCGRVNHYHPLRDYLLGIGIQQAELDWFMDNPCPPDVIGANYYLTSERFLDERIELYPDCINCNAERQYVDVEAVRVRAEGLAGPKVMLKELWERYHLPIAITELQCGCNREEQLHWFIDNYNAVRHAQDEGVEICAITAWALLGAYNWNSLVTQDTGYYESGAFDVRGPEVRPTALAKMLSALGHGQQFTHPVLAIDGWWRQPKRFIYGFELRGSESKPFPIESAINTPPESMQPKSPILITGATGTLGSIFAKTCELRGLPFLALKRTEMDIADPLSVAAALDKYRPWAVINAAGYVRVDDAERETQRCFGENTHGPATIAQICNERGIQFLSFSSDLVFDGNKTTPYLESDFARPLNIYGQSKTEAERMVLGVMPSALVIRTSAFFSPWDSHNFVTKALNTLKAGEVFAAADDLTISPTYVPDLVNICVDLLIDGECGIWHLTNQGEMTWADLARMAAKLAGLSVQNVVSGSSEELNFVAPRPAYSALGSERGLLLPPLDNALSRYIAKQ